MTDTNKTSLEQWTRERAIVLAVVCLAAGIAGGWFIRGSQGPGTVGPEQASIAQTPVVNATAVAPQAPGPAQLKQMADAQAAPLIDKLRTDPKNAEVLAGIGNVYYDAQQYPIAIDYYGRALIAKPSDASVRTDLGTAYWFTGNADAAIAEFNKALTFEPTNPNTLFNRGLVKWQGKKDSAGAVADWEKLLAANPHYASRDKVEQMMADVKKQAGIKPGLKAN
jgi:tetratricopeptide (TPR) repeat protein